MIIESKPLHKKKKRLAKQNSKRQKENAHTSPQVRLTTYTFDRGAVSVLYRIKCFKYCNSVFSWIVICQFNTAFSEDLAIENRFRILESMKFGLWSLVYVRLSRYLKASALGVTGRRSLWKFCGNENERQMSHFFMFLHFVVLPCIVFIWVCVCL